VTARRTVVSFGSHYHTLPIPLVEDKVRMWFTYLERAGVAWPSVLVALVNPVCIHHFADFPQVMTASEPRSLHSYIIGSRSLSLF
jgi:hypothetical protein